MSRRVDVIVVGAGHNGLVAALILAREGLDVLVLEAQPMIGGAARSERPFAKAPELISSTGAYLLGLMPPELFEITGVTLPLIRRDPHYFLPRRHQGYLLFGSDKDATRQQFLQFFSEQDWKAHESMQAELAALREDIAPTWLQAPVSIDDTAERFVRPLLKDIFVNLCRQPVRDYLERFEFKSDLVKAMYAVTDAFSGLCGSWDTPGTGMNFLVHNMCRLPASDGTWMVVEGGMGVVTSRFADAARRHGAAILTGCQVRQINVEHGTVTGVTTADDEEIRATAVVVNADPFRMRDLVGADFFPADYNSRLDRYRKPGTTFKLNLAMSGLPSFTCLPGSDQALGATIHLLPDENDVMAALQAAFRDAIEGRLPQFPAIEWYIHSAVDPSVKDSAGRHSAALFVQWVPYELKISSWDAEQTRYAEHLLSICDRFAPGTTDLVVDLMPLHPQSIEQHFGITLGHIHHIDNSFGFDERLPYAQPVGGLYSCSAGTHPAGSVIGCAGHNAATQLLEELGKREREKAKTRT